MNSHGVNEFVHSFFHAKVQHSHTYVVDNIGASLFAQKILLLFHKSTCLYWKISGHFLCFVFDCLSFQSLTQKSLLLKELRKADAFKIFYMQKIHEHLEFISDFCESIFKAYQIITNFVIIIKQIPLFLQVSINVLNCSQLS